MRYFLVVLVLLGSTLGVAQQESIPTVTEPNADSSSAKVFLDLMDDPVAKAHFRNLQRVHLNTAVDREMQIFFSTNPLLKRMYNSLIEGQDEMLQDFSLGAKANSVRVIKGLTPEYDLIYSMIADTAGSLGFSREAIQNLEFYVQDGTKNAYTVSGSDKRIIVVLQSEIIEKLELGELRAVIGHELGHIRSNHMINGRMNLLMLTMLEALVTKNISDGAPAESMLTTHPELRELMLRVSFGLEQNHGSRGRSKAPDKRNPLGLPAKALAEGMALTQVLTTNPQVLYSLLDQYLTMGIRALSEMGATSKVIGYFSTIKATLPLADIAPKLNPEEFLQNAIELINAISRAQELSSDRISASIVENSKLAGGFAKLLGLRFSKANRKKILDHIDRTAKELLESTTVDELAPVIGGSHPSLSLRVRQMLHIPGYPTILFANRFMRILLVHESVQAARLGIEKTLTLVPDADPRKEKLAQGLTRVQATADKIQKLVLDLLREGERAGKKNPRLANLAEFMLAEREMVLVTKGAIEAQLKATAHAPEGVELARVMSEVLAQKDLLTQANNALITKVQELAGQNHSLKQSGEYLPLLELAKTSEDVPKLQVARQEINKGLENRKTRLPKDIAEALRSEPVPKAQKADPVPTGPLTGIALCNSEMNF